MIILGIDPGTATTGYGIIDGTTNTPTILEYGVIETPAGMPDEERLSIIRGDIGELLTQFKPGIVGVEKLYFSTNVKTAMTVAQARGIVLERVFSEGIALVEYNPLEIKNTVTGYGGADKKQMQECVKMHFNMSVIPKPDDAADALGLALCVYFHRAWELGSGR